MNGYGDYKDPLTESYDDYVVFDEEDVATTAEFKPLGAVSSAIGGLLGGGGRRRPVQQASDHRHMLSAPGVRDARLETPRGSANLRLPEEVVSKRVFDQTTAGLQAGITGVTARINSLEQKDLPELKKELGALLASTRQAIADEMKARKKAMARQARAQQSAQTTTLMMNLLFQQQLQRKLESHFHTAVNLVPDGSQSTATPLSSDDNKALIFLPMMMMGDGMGGGGSDKEGDSGDSYRENGNDDVMKMMVMMTLLK